MTVSRSQEETAAIPEGRGGFALAELLIVTLLAGGLLSVAFAVHTLQPSAPGDEDQFGFRPAAPARPVPIHGFAVSSRRGTVLLRELHGAVRLCDLATGADLPWALSCEGVSAIAQSESGDLLAAGYSDGTLALSSAEADAPILLRDAHSAAVRALACSDDGAIVVSGDDSGVVRACDPQGALLWNAQGHSQRTEWLAFRPDGNLLASAGGDGVVQLWDVKSGRRVQTLRGHAWSVTRVAFASDGRRLVSGSLDQTIRVWDLETGSTLWTSARQSGPILALACAPDEPLFASGSYEGSLRLWSLDTFAPCDKLEGHTETVRCLQFSADGRLLFSAGYDGQLQIWGM